MTAISQLAPAPAPDESEVADVFKVAMSRLAAGVVMVTCHVDGKPWGLTVSACCSVSMNPPLLLVSLSSETTSAHAIARSGRFGVSLLGESLIDVARFGAARGQAKFVHEHCRGGDHPAVSPVVSGSLAAIDCTVEQVVPAGDHTIFIGAVQCVLTPRDDRPLVYFSRSYHRLGTQTDLAVGPAAEDAVDSLLHDHPFPRRLSRTDPLL